MPKKLTLKTDPKKISLQESFADFISYKKAIDLADVSIENYKSVFRYFTDFIGENLECSEITEDIILKFINHCRDNNPDISATTINTYLRHLRAIFYFFMEKEYMPTYKIKMIRAEKSIKETYTESEKEKLLKKPDIKKCSFSELRNWVMICYLLGTGNRLSTIQNLKIGDIDFNNQEIQLLKVKNRKAYSIPLSPTLSKILQEYLTYRKGEPDDYLFCSQYGEQMHKDSIKNAIRRYNLSRGVSKTSIHLFRNTFAKDWILNGGDIFRLQKILGHSSLEMVRQYVDMFGGDLKKDFSSYNSLDNSYRAKTKIKKLE